MSLTPSGGRKRRKTLSRSRTRSHSADKKRRRRSRSKKRSYTRSRSRSPSRSRRQRTLSKDRRRSVSLERRREERKRRHAETEKREQQRNEKRPRRSSTDAAPPAVSAPTKPAHVDNATVTDPEARITERQRRTVDLLTSRTGGAYIPPAKLRMLQAEITDKTSAAYQRIAWEALKKSIHGYINKVNVFNIAIITRELLKENIVRGRGLLCRSIIQAQAASPTFTHVYAALVAIINSKFPNIGELLLRRLIIQFRRAFRRNDKVVCLSSSRFIGHLVNQRVAHEILALEILTLLVEKPTDDSVEVAIAFLKECGMKLTEVTSKGVGAIFEMLKNILHEGKLDKRVQYMIEVVFQVRKDGFKDHQSVIENLELVEEDDQYTHLFMIEDAKDPEDGLNVFKYDDKYETNEGIYKGLSWEILGSDASGSDGSSSGSSSDSGSDGSADSDAEDGEKDGKSADAIIDNTETNLIALRRTIYLTINSSLDYEECAHKLMKMQLKPGQEIELCHMFLDCCAEQRTYEKFYGLLAQRFCAINKIYIEPFEEIFRDTYQTTHRLDTNRLRNVSKFFAHLLFTDAISWDVLECIKLNEEDTTSSSRIFIKILFQELAEYMGLSKLNNKLKDDVLVESLAGLFPRDNPRNTRFAINFFTSIGLGGLTDELRQFLKNAPKSVPAINAELLASKPINVNSSSMSSSSSGDSSTSDSSSDSSSGSSDSTSPTSSDSSDSSVEEKEARKKAKKRKQQKHKSKALQQKKNTKKSGKMTNKNSKGKNKKKANASSTDSSDTESDTDSDDNLGKKKTANVQKDNTVRKNGEEHKKDDVRRTVARRERGEEKHDRARNGFDESEKNRKHDVDSRAENRDRERPRRNDKNGSDYREPKRKRDEACDEVRAERRIVERDNTRKEHSYNEGRHERNGDHRNRLNERKDKDRSRSRERRDRNEKRERERERERERHDQGLKRDRRRSQSRSREHKNRIEKRDERDSRREKDKRSGEKRSRSRDRAKIRSTRHTSKERA